MLLCNSYYKIQKIYIYKSCSSKVLGYTYFDDPSLTVKQRRRFKDAETREIFLIKNDHEVRESVLDTINDSIAEPIQGNSWYQRIYSM